MLFEIKPPSSSHAPMHFKILNNKLIQVMRPGVAMFNPHLYNEYVVYPIVKISCVHLVDKCITIALDNSGTDKITYENKDSAKHAFDILINAMSGKMPLAENEGPSPDLWAIEQLQ